VVPPGGSEPPTGLFFANQTVDDLVEAMARFEREEGMFDPKALRCRAEAFDRPLFKEGAQRYLDARLMEHRAC
jgi:hypothetical protein